MRHAASLLKKNAEKGAKDNMASETTLRILKGQRDGDRCGIV